MATSELSHIFRLLGGKRAIGKSLSKSQLELHKLVMDGIPVRSAFMFKELTGFSNLAMCAFLGVSEKTFIRWNEHPDQNLSSVVSDRLVRTARIMGLAEEVLESSENAKKWLNEPQPALANEVPRDLLSSNVGAQQVADLLLQMEHGYLA